MAGNETIFVDEAEIIDLINEANSAVDKVHSQFPIFLTQIFNIVLIHKSAKSHHIYRGIREKMSKNIHRTRERFNKLGQTHQKIH